ncbi:hypothetical protein FRC07_005708 [Ceratobasidium sp. 392]|nr:hypothetical protein FRC07_005708 [Ceratobasidium sp. 392]
MQSLFSRARTTSQTARNSQAQSASDEFGRVGGGRKSDTLPPLPRKDKEKKEKKDKSQRQRTISIPKDNRPSFLRSSSPEPELPAPQLPPLQAGGFLPRYIPAAPTSTESEDLARQPYGYLHTEKDVILSLGDVQRLLAVLGEELTLRGLSTPLLFSTQALDVSAPRVRNLIRAFLGTCSDPISRSGDARFREEARFAGPHEVAMTIRWGLARIVRMVNGAETHGFMEFDVYRAWKMSEESQRFPPDHFASIVPGIPPPARPIFTSLFTLLSRLVAYSTVSGLTPSMLAGYFGPLIFGLIPATTATFSSTLTAFHRAAHATEHLLLSHIRWEDDIQRRKTPGTGGLPSRLKEWIRGYPSMLPRLGGEADLDRVRRGARTVRVASVRRNVRLYSPDLVQSAAGWAGEGDLSGRAEWLRVVPKHSGLQARYTDSYRKRLDIPVPTADSRGPSSDNGHGSWLSSETSSLTAPATGVEDAKYSSLTDMRWGEFEALGFGGGEPEKRLQFDLNEGARQKQTRMEKRTTMTWNDFSTAGFLRDDSPLSDTLQFAAPLQTTIQTWPTTSEDIHRKLKKQQKVLPTFGWETTPVAGQEWVVEEAFLDCWADLIWSSGWSEREERTHRDSNWALIDFKALPANPAATNLLSPSDPRTSNQWFVFEEFVPREYRDQLTNPKKKRNALGFSVKPKQWKPATTLNGKPYTSGMAPHSPGYGASEFDAMLRSSKGVTRKISAGDDTTESWGSIPPGANGTAMLRVATPTQYASPIQTQALTPPPTTPKRLPPSPRVGSASRPGLSSRFRIGSAKRSNIGSEYDPSLEFETRTASEGSDGSPDRLHPEHSFGLGGPSPPGKKHSRRESKDDAWVDILVADQARRMRDQDATFSSRGGGVAFPTGSSSTLRRGRATSDPDIQQQHQHQHQHQQHRMAYDEEEEYTTGTAPVPSSPPAGYRSEDEEVMPIPRESSPDPAAHIMVNPDPVEPAIPGRPSQETRYEEDQEDYEPDSDFEPTSDDHHTREDMTSQSFALSDAGYREDDPTTSSLGQEISPKLFPRTGGGMNGERTGGAVSSLVSMYAERDAQALTAMAKPSRLPVRTASKGQVPDDELIAPPIPPALEPGRASPSRYIHGAPLQNVLEEEDD